MDIFYYSQKDITDEAWKLRACGVLCVAMLLRGKITPDELIVEGVALGAYMDSVGWKHDGLVMLLRNHGVLAYRQEFRSHSSETEKKFLEQQKEKIISELEAGRPVIVSVTPKFRTNETSHLIVLTGHKDGAFIFNDPDDREGRGEALTTPEKHLFSHLRPFVIFVE